MSWKTELEGPKWVPVLNHAEVTYGIPTDLLARVAYQESSFKPSVIDGTEPSPAGALGLMQLMPQFFISVRVSIPFDDTVVTAQIDEAARFIMSLHGRTGQWDLTLAAYNAGLGSVEKYGGVPPFQETENYVAQILADVPVGGTNA